MVSETIGYALAGIAAAEVTGVTDVTPVSAGGGGGDDGGGGGGPVVPSLPNVNVSIPRVGRRGAGGGGGGLDPAAVQSAIQSAVRAGQQQATEAAGGGGGPVINVPSVPNPSIPSPQVPDWTKFTPPETPDVPTTGGGDGDPVVPNIVDAPDAGGYAIDQIEKFRQAGGSAGEGFVNAAEIPGDFADRAVPDSDHPYGEVGRVVEQGVDAARNVKVPSLPGSGGGGGDGKTFDDTAAEATGGATNELPGVSGDTGESDTSENTSDEPERSEEKQERTKVDPTPDSPIDLPPGGL